ncbi:MAG TPA: fumarylacetoacetate hydrolase family protein [Gammaproteobacteria bacterium]|nr:fumarylacetoacetate hydrolase family protein [Gammaproteobacteria bacterium]
MRLLSFRAGGRDRFGIARDDGIVDLSARLGKNARSLGELIAGDLSRARAHEDAAETDFAPDDIEYLPPIARPGKIVCIGVNYGNRNAEYRDDSEAPKYPSVFMRTPESLVGHDQPIFRPPESEQLDYEGEIVLVIGRRGRRIAREAAWQHVAGLSLMNEGSVRDWLRHARFNVTQGKNFERSGAWGPWITTPDDMAPDTPLHLTTRVNGELRQDDTTSNLIFPFDYLISYLSTFMPLAPGDIIATGTPTGAGARFDPPKYLKHGDVVTIHVPELGTLENRVEDEALDP